MALVNSSRPAAVGTNSKHVKILNMKLSRTVLTCCYSASPFPQQVLPKPNEPYPLEAACSANKALIGVTPQGYRGLLAASDIAAGDVVLTIPLHNMLQVPRQATQPHMQAATATAAALSTWQQHHGHMPQTICALLASPDAIWESKLVAWLLYLREAAPAFSLWHSYCQVLPTAAETITFCSYSPQQAEQLQFSTWKALAEKQQQLLLTVQQQCRAAGLDSCIAAARSASPTAHTSGQAASNASKQPGGGSSSSTDSVQDPDSPALQEADYAWALSMVKSRTFGQQLRGLQGPASVSPQDTPAAAAAAGLKSQPSASSLALSPADGAAAATAAPKPPATAAAAGKDDGELEGDDSNVILLMAPFLDLINHASNNNCVFGIDPEGCSFSVRCGARAGITRGQEITISYGSNKSNLALLSCYGFQIPANPNDIQLVTPILQSCLATTGGCQGFNSLLLQEAAEGFLTHGQPQQGNKHHPQELLHQQLRDQGSELAGWQQEVLREMLSPELVTARQHNAVAAMPVQPQQQDDVQGQLIQSSQQQQLQQQKYVAQLMSYQLGLVFKRCGTTTGEDVDQLAHLRLMAACGNSSSCGDGHWDGSSEALAIQQQAVAARLEHKLLLDECRSLLQRLQQVIEGKLPKAQQ